MEYNYDLVNLQNRLTNCELEIMWLKNELNELRKDIIKNAFKKSYTHDDLA